MPGEEGEGDGGGAISAGMHGASRRAMAGG